ncbi:MAG: helix-turn-helix transcriptional regulator [Planctomycetota bacterium]
MLTSTQQRGMFKPNREEVSQWEVIHMEFGQRLRELRKGRGMTLRGLAEAVGVDFTYLSKIENGKAGYMPGADTIRSLASELDADPLELLQLADKVPPEMEGIASDTHARRFLKRAREVASPDDWEALLDMLDERQKDRERRKKE